MLVSCSVAAQLTPGILYNVLVARPAMYWPSTLVIVQLFTTLFDETASAGSAAARRLTSKRLQVFVLIFLATFIYQVGRAPRCSATQSLSSKLTRSSSRRCCSRR